MMNYTTFGDMTQFLALRRQQTTLKTEITALSTSLTTGLATDPVRHLNGDTRALTGIDMSLTRLNAYRQVTAEATAIAQSMQAALETMGSVSADTASTLLTAATSTDASVLTAAGLESRQSFETVIAALNTRIGQQSIFAGSNAGANAMASAETILDALATATAGASTAGELSDMVDDWFNDPAGFGSVAYLGGAARAGFQVSDGDTLSLGITAQDGAIKDLLRGLAKGALLEGGALSGDLAERTALAQTAATDLSSAESGRAWLAASLGITEARLDSATTRNEAERSALMTARTNLISVDPYEAASRLEEAETQLNMLYALTARMTSLSLVDYL